jgi:hypothetical protein
VTTPTAAPQAAAGLDAHPDTVTVRGVSFPLRAPRSQAQIAALVGLAADGPVSPAMAGAALGLCSPRGAAKALGFDAVPWQGRAWSYGEAVYDALIAAGATHVELVAAGHVAYNVAILGMIRVGEVAAAEAPFGGSAAPPSTGS